MDIQTIINAISTVEIEAAQESSKKHFEDGESLSRMNMIAFD